MSPVAVRAATPEDRDAIRARLREWWAGETMVARGREFRPADLPAFLAVDGDAIVGLVTFAVEDDGTCEITSLDSSREGQGVGSALLEAAEGAAKERGCARMRLVTTNDNLTALGFYQKRGYRIVAVDPGAVDRARAVKPTIPLVADNGIPLHDELTLEKSLEGGAA